MVLVNQFYHTFNKQSSDLTIRYNEDTDIIQCKIGSEWLDWLVAGMRILKAWVAGVTSGFTATTGGGGGAGIGEITYNNIPNGSSIKISNLSLPYGTNNTITFYVKVNGVSVLTTNGNYTIITDNSTLVIYMYIYLSEENKGGY